jgi:uncharacterized protein (UPF0248 family)
MNKIRDILNELKWRKKFIFQDTQIYYIHRGAPNNTKIINGSEIIAIDKTFIETKESMIPHHRIFKIIYQNHILFDREKHT